MSFSFRANPPHSIERGLFVLNQHRDIYSSPTLADVFPSVLSAAGLPDERNELNLPPAPRTVVLLIDGLGHELLQRNCSSAPFLSGQPTTRIKAGFPTTTATSLASLCTGVPTGRHGITGYQSYIPEIGGILNWLQSTVRGHDGEHQLTSTTPIQASTPRTVFVRAVAAGVSCTVVMPAHFRDSGFSRLLLNGADFIGTHAYGDLLAETVDASTRADRTLTYCYISELDTVGHNHGPESLGWRTQLQLIDQFVKQLAHTLPRSVRLFVTADHGMIDARRGRAIDIDAESVLTGSVRAISGEPRCRHLHTVKPAEVAARWTDFLAHDGQVLTRADAIDRGLFGAHLSATAAERIGDVLVIANGATTLMRTKHEPNHSRFPGQHGGLTSNDQNLWIPGGRTFPDDDL
uniref:Type I phosphodiesterase/nucleotide pyrophosphatase n=1 Tax=Rhodococcus sp. NS1 TaxID=402236 RepID=A0A097SQN8_9NOCA|nr:hypothetical protein LRS1606.391 [Rhodococcus sp. NS1]